MTNDQLLNASGGPAYPTLSVVKADKFGGERMADVPGMTLHDRAAIEAFGKIILATMTNNDLAAVFAKEAEMHGVSMEALVGRKAVQYADYFVQARGARLREITGLDLDMPSPNAEILEHARVFVRVIADVETRCMTTDGPVTPTLKKIEEDELARLWRAAQGIIAASSVLTATGDDDGPREE